MVTYTDTQISNFVIEYLQENLKVQGTFLACSHVAQVEWFKQKNRSRKSRDTVPLRQKEGLGSKNFLLGPPYLCPDVRSAPAYRYTLF